MAATIGPELATETITRGWDATSCSYSKFIIALIVPGHLEAFPPLLDKLFASAPASIAGFARPTNTEFLKSDPVVTSHLRGAYDATNCGEIS